MRTPKKLTALILTGALTASSIAAVPASAKTFTDVPSTHWAYTVIDEVSNKTIMIGTDSGIFSPNKVLTRAEYAAVLMNLTNDKNYGSIEATYTDVPSTAWYASSVKWAVSRGLFTVKNGKFEPNKPISRELMADMTYKFIYYIYTSHIIPNTTSAGYADESSFSSEYAGSINALTHNGYLSGRGDNKFEPQGTLTRAEAAAMASRLLPIVEDDSEPEDPSNPSEPEDPSEPSEPEDPGETEDPNDPSNWDLDGAPEWFLVGRPDGITVEQWNELITYWADKEKPDYYWDNIPASVTTEEQAKNLFEASMISLYDDMQRDYAAQALVTGDLNISSEEKNMINLINNKRQEVGVNQLTISPDLCRAAQIRAKEALSCEAHKRPDGSTFSTVLQDVNLIFTSCSGTYNHITLSENQTVRPTNKPFPSMDAFNNFVQSPAHYRNMTDADHQYVGIGYYSNGTKSSWVQLFAKIQ